MSESIRDVLRVSLLEGEEFPKDGDVILERGGTISGSKDITIKLKDSSRKYQSTMLAQASGPRLYAGFYLQKDDKASGSAGNITQYKMSKGKITRADVVKALEQVSTYKLPSGNNVWISAWGEYTKLE